MRGLDLTRTRLHEERSFVDRLLAEAGGAMVKVPKGAVPMSMIADGSGNATLGRLASFLVDVLKVRQSVVVKNDNGVLNPGIAAQAAKMAAGDLGMVAGMAASIAPDAGVASALAKTMDVRVKVGDDGIEFKLAAPLAKMKKAFGKAWPKPVVFMAEADEGAVQGGGLTVRRKLREEPESILGPGAQIPADSDLATMFKTVKNALGRFDTVVSIQPQIKFGGGSLTIAWSKVKAERQSVPYLNNPNAMVMVQGFDDQGMAKGGKVKAETLTAHPRDLKIRAVSGEPGKVANALIKAFTTLATSAEKTEDVFEVGARMVEVAGSALGGANDVWQHMLAGLAGDVKMGADYVPTKGVMQTRESNRQFDVMKAFARKIRDDAYGERDGSGFMLGFRNNKDVDAHNQAIGALVKELNDAGFSAKKSSSGMRTGVALVQPNAELMKVVLGRYDDYLVLLAKKRAGK